MLFDELETESFLVASSSTELFFYEWVRVCLYVPDITEDMTSVVFPSRCKLFLINCCHGRTVGRH